LDLGLGSIGRIGRGYGFADGDIRSVRDRLRKGPRALSPCSTENPCPETVSGRLPADVIQRVVRQSFGRFRLCYENDLRTQPHLSGRVSVRFVVALDGSVASASVADTSLSTSAASCVARAFAGLSFPAPDGGIVTVTYPIQFSPE
jgi:hypothetical protein